MNRSIVNIQAVTTASCKVNRKSLSELNWFCDRTQISLRENAKVSRGNAKFLEGTQSFSRERKVSRGNAKVLRGNAKFLERTQSFSRERKVSRENKSFSRERKTFEKYFFLPPWIFSTHPKFFPPPCPVKGSVTKGHWAEVAVAFLISRRHSSSRVTESSVPCSHSPARIAVLWARLCRAVCTDYCVSTKIVRRTSIV